LRDHVKELLEHALGVLRDAGELALEATVDVPVERARDPRHGDFASPVALLLARGAGRKPRDIAELVARHLPASEAVARVEIAGPGFINFFLTRGAYQALVREILGSRGTYGRSRLGAGHRVQVEFVSANPTGPLHVGHGRGAAIGAAIAELLAASGFGVEREYYVNDAGRQMDTLTVSVWLRYLSRYGEPVGFPEAGYRGDYVHAVAKALADAHSEAFRADGARVAAELPPDAPAGDKEAHLDALIARTRALLGEERYRVVACFALDAILADIRDDLAGFGVHFDVWYRESSLVDRGTVARTVEGLRAAGYVYERDRALWFRSTEFGDEKDRVVVRESGQPTYFASDIAYHADKLERGFERLIDIWGADHHGYIARVKGALQALHEDPDRLEVVLVQMAHLFRGGEKVSMSKRSGEFVTLRELREEVGDDAARFFFVLRKSDQQLEFDLDLARTQSADNPVYYVQYAHARICSVRRQCAEKGYAWEPEAGTAHLGRLVETHELASLRTLSRYPEVIESAALAREPHQLAFYLRELANDFHTYYNSHTFLVPERELRAARLALIEATRQVIAGGLALLGVSAPEAM
jgi:arginyl-tRNA synthetase